MGETRTAAVVIPARLGSRRFPRKVLARDTGKFLVQHVWEAVVGCPGISRVIVATDSGEVCDAVRSFGGDARMTSPDHISGTDRVAEVAEELSDELIINVQGDEPLISPEDLRRLIDLFEAPAVGAGDRARVEMTTLAVRRTDREGFHDPNIVKAVVGRHGRALYFSRAPLPYWPADPEGPGSAGRGDLAFEWWQHLGLYGYRREFLLRFPKMEPTPMEKRERLEQLRALENGALIRVGESTGRHIGIDTAEEYGSFVKEYLRGQGSRVEVSSPQAPSQAEL